MTAPRRFVTCLVLSLALTGAAATQSAAQGGGKPKVVFAGGFVYHSQVIPAGDAPLRFEVSCPPGYAATGGTISSTDPKLLSLLSIGVGAGKAWAFAFRNTDTQAHTVVVVVTCTKALKLPPLGGVVKLSTVKALQPGQAAKIMAKCVKGSVPVSDAEQSGDAPKSVGGIGGVQVTSVSLGKRDVTVEAFNPTATEQQVQVGASCIPKDLKHKAVQIDRHSFDLTVGANGSVVNGACPGAVPLFAGYSAPPGGEIGFLGAGFRKTELTASWAFSNSSGQPQPVEVSLACTPGKVKFVEGLDETTAAEPSTPSSAR